MKITRTVAPVLAGLALVSVIAQPAHAVSNTVKNIGTKNVAVDDSCRSKVSLAPGQKVNLSCGGRRFWVNATDCVTINRVGFAPRTYCAGGRGSWQGFNWAPGTTTLSRTN